jgi:hypothetical protein
MYSTIQFEKVKMQKCCRCCSWIVIFLYSYVYVCSLLQCNLYLLVFAFFSFILFPHQLMLLPLITKCKNQCYNTFQGSKLNLEYYKLVCLTTSTSKLVWSLHARQEYLQSSTQVPIHVRIKWTCFPLTNALAYCAEVQVSVIALSGIEEERR